MVAQKTDLMVFDAKGRPVLAVEVDNQVDLTREKAMAFRKDVAPHLVGGSTPYLLLASQDRGYLWLHNQTASPDAAPDVEFSMTPVIAHYGRDEGNPSQRIRGSQVEIFVWSWLLDLARSPGGAAGNGTPLPDPMRALLPDLRGGTVQMEQSI